MHATVADGVVYGAGGGSPERDGALAAVDLETGRHRWEATVVGCGYVPSAGRDTVAIPVDCRGEGGHVEVFDRATGCRHGRLDLGTDQTPAGVVSDGTLYVADGSGGRLWAIPLP